MYSKLILASLLASASAFAPAQTQRNGKLNAPFLVSGVEFGIICRVSDLEVGTRLHSALLLLRS